MAVVYNDEDNVPMTDFGEHNPTVYMSYSEMRAAQMNGSYGKPRRKNGCGNCDCYDGLMCDRYFERREPGDWCVYHEKVRSGNTP